MLAKNENESIARLINALIASGIRIGRKTQIQIERDFDKASHVPEIKKFLEWDPLVLSDIAPISGSRSLNTVSSIRFDQQSNLPNLKKPIVSGLLLRGLLTGELNSRTELIMDGGNVNTGLALGYYAKKLDLKVEYIVSRYFLDEMVAVLEAPHVSVTKAPPSPDLGLEEEFYIFLRERFIAFRRKQNIFATWHAKRCFFAAKMYSRHIASSFTSSPDAIVTAVGSGATLALCYHLTKQLAQKFKKQISVVVAEPELSPIYAKTCKVRPAETLNKVVENLSFSSSATQWGAKKHWSKRLPHLILGPHYEKANPLMPKKIENSISYVQVYTQQQFEQFASAAETHNLLLGNTSLANILVAEALRSEGSNVLTFALEPFRSYTRIHK